MSPFKLETPVVLIIFNRPESTKRVFEEIKKAQPSKLLIIADGSRESKEGEALKCQATREIVEHIDWECEVLKNYSDVNLGCKKRIASGLDWVFANVDEAIILEDDCLPDQTFFSYCQKLLRTYESDDRIMMISGSNFSFGTFSPATSYYFSKTALIWGWAT